MGDQIGRRGSGGEALKPTLGRTLADVQGRLIYRCQAFIKDDVSAYTPTAADIDYPAKLQKALAEAAAADVAAAVAAVEDGEGISASNGGAATSNGASTSANGKASGAVWGDLCVLPHLQSCKL